MRHYHSRRHFLTHLGFGLSLVEAVSPPLPLPSAHYAEWTRHSPPGLSLDTLSQLERLDFRLLLGGLESSQLGLHCCSQESF